MSLEVGEVGRAHVGRAAAGLHLPRHLLQLLARARDQEHLAAGVADLERGLESDAARGAGDEDAPALDRSGERAVAEEVRVEVALPVVPQLRGIGGERRDRDPRAGERPLGVTRVELAPEVAVLHGLGPDAEVVEGLVADPLDRGQRHEAGPHRLRDGVRHVLVDAHGELGRVRGLGELVQRLAHLHRLWVDEVEGVARQLAVGEVGDVVHRPGDEVHRDEVRLAALGTGEREPLGQAAAQALEELEEVVRTVELVHLARLRVADHDPGAEHEQLRPDVVARHLLRLVLRAVVGVRQLLALLEHVLLEDAPVPTGDRDRADVVEAPHPPRVRELDHVVGALHVCREHRLAGDLDVVDGREVEEVVDRVLEALDAEPRLRHVAVHRGDAPRGRAEALCEGVHLPA
jgi:hypothetical protein